MSNPPASIRRARGRETVPDGRSTLLAHGESMVWLTGGGLALATFMIVSLLAYVFCQGIATFWPRPLIQIQLHSGTTLLGEVTRNDYYDPGPAALDALPPDLQHTARTHFQAETNRAHRRLLRTGNFELTGEHFNWISDAEIADESHPPWALVIERLTWGRFYGLPKTLEVIHPLPVQTRVAANEFCNRLPQDSTRILRYQSPGASHDPLDFSDDVPVTAVVEIWTDPAAIWTQFNRHHETARTHWRDRRRLEKVDSGAISHKAEEARLALRQAGLDADRTLQRYGADDPRTLVARQNLNTVRLRQAQTEAWADGAFQRVRHRINELNAMNENYRIEIETASGQTAWLHLAEIVRAYPANSLSLGQRIIVFAARWHEFLTEDPREANMEGGVWPAIFGTVTMTLLMSLAVVPFGVLAALYLREYAKAGPMISAVRIAINNLAGVPSIVFGVFGLGFFCYHIGGAVDQLFFEAKLPSPTYGTGGIMWASLTLALLTLPVVIVATEEALSAVPSSMREGSYACGAGKWQTLRRIVLPRAMPGIMTGMILAMARGAGEVAPLMLVGAVKLAPELPLDGIPPFIHPERSFMHLGFHIFDLGFQSQNSEAAKPMVFTTTLLLIAIIAALNIAAVLIRNRLRRRYLTSAF